MHAQLTVGEGLKRTLNVTIPAETVDGRLNSRLDAVAKNAKIAGFRPGKVPVKVVKERMMGQVAADVARDLVQEFLFKAIKEQSIPVAGQPNLRMDDNAELTVHENQEFTFVADLEVLPTFEPAGFEKLKLTRDVAEADDEIVNAALKRLEEQLRDFKAKDGKAEKGDRLTMTGQGYTVDGDKEEAFPGGNLENFKVVLGSGQLIPGFEDGLVDTKKGDAVDLQVTFPADYHAKELAGKPAVFKLRIDLVEGPVDAPLSDESVQQLGFKTLDDLKDVLKKGAERDLKAASEQRLKRQLLDALDAANSFDLPQNLVSQEHSTLWRAQIHELQQRNLPLEALGKTPEEIIADLKPLAERRVKLGLLLAELAKRNNLTVTQDEVNEAVQNQIAAAGPQRAQAQQYFANAANRQQLSGPILEDKVTNWLLEQAEISENKISATELLTELQ